MEKYCIMCGSKMNENVQFCTNCGSNQFSNEQPNNQSNVVSDKKSRTIAGVLGVLFGALGVHNFYLGNTSRGLLQIFLTIITCSAGGLWGVTEGVLILLGYINEDANGIPLDK